jgi:hypothetical protein
LQGYGVNNKDGFKLKAMGTNMIQRRDFLRTILLGTFFSFFSKKIKAEKKPEEKLKKAMFWKRLD